MANLSGVLTAMIIAGALGMGGNGEAMEISKHMVFEAAMESRREYGNPICDVTVRVHFVAPSGARRTVDAFWDGGRTWRVRFSPDKIGEWRWRSECSDDANAGLHGRQGEFQCTAYKGDNTVYAHGPIKLSADRRHFVRADKVPFFWLADTAWNGVLRAKSDDWDRYLKTRREQGFTAIQFVCTNWRALDKDGHGEVAYTSGESFRINPSFFQRLDAKVAAINEHGLIAVPVILWAQSDIDPGRTLPENDAIRLARYIVARWGAHQVVWILGGDGNYSGDRYERWKHIGRETFKDRHDRLVTMHPSRWPGEEYRRETWFDFFGYQSGHGDSKENLQWLVTGAPAQDWRKDPPRPIVNLEPNYEEITTYHSKTPIKADRVRRALYWSLLVSPTAGVTYGHNGIWPWSEVREEPLNHAGEAPPWHESMHTEGIVSVEHLKKFFASLPWWRLMPAQELLAEQPGEREPELFVAAAKTDNGDAAVVYMPKGGSVTIRTDSLKRPSVARWFNPRTGELTEAGEITGAKAQFTTPDGNDWVLCIRHNP